MSKDETCPDCGAPLLSELPPYKGKRFAIYVCGSRNIGSWPTAACEYITEIQNELDRHRKATLALWNSADGMKFGSGKAFVAAWNGLMELGRELEKSGDITLPEPEEPEDEHCGATIEYGDEGTMTCFLEKGHEGEHDNGRITWGSNE